MDILIFKNFPLETIYAKIFINRKVFQNRGITLSPLKSFPEGKWFKANKILEVNSHLAQVLVNNGDELFHPQKMSGDGRMAGSL